MIAQNKICRAGALLLLIALMLCLGCMAQAETDPVDFTMEISPASLQQFVFCSVGGCAYVLLCRA